MFNKKGILLLITAMVVLVLSACSEDKSSKSNANANKVYAFTFNNWLSSTHYISKAFEEWADLVDKETEGRVKIDLYHGGALGGQLAVHEDIAGGTYDIGEASMSTLEDTDAFIQSIGDLPFAFDNINTSFEVMRKFMDKYENGIYQELDLKYISNSTSQKYAIHSTKKIASVDDAKGLIINASSPKLTKVFEGWGASREGMAFAELYQAVQRGTIDALWTPAPSSYDTSFYEVAPYVTKFNGPSYNFQGVFLMNLDKFNELPEDLQAKMEELFPLLGEMHKNSYDTDEVVWSTIEKQFETAKGEVIELTPEEEAKFRAAAKPVWEDWVKKANSKGLPGDEMMDYFKSLLEEAGVEVMF